jgi:hypothetical protein
MTPDQIKIEEKALNSLDRIKRETEEKRDKDEKFLIEFSRIGREKETILYLVNQIKKHTEYIAELNQLIGEKKRQLINLGVNC